MLEKTPLLCMCKIMEYWEEYPIDLELLEKNTKVMTIVFNHGLYFNYCTDQIMVLKIVPIVIQATKSHEDAEVKGGDN